MIKNKYIIYLYLFKYFKEYKKGIYDVMNVLLKYDYIK